MLLYNWPKIYDAAGGDPYECIKIVKMMVEGTIPKNTYDPLYIYSTINFAGDSFLVHPDILLFNAYKYSCKDVAIYMSMASIRPLTEFLANDVIYLPKFLAPINPVEHLDDPHSGLITVDEENIYFLYESTPEIIH